MAAAWCSNSGAPAAAIICAVDYPEPFTIEELKREYPGMPPSAVQSLFDNRQCFHEEREYVVDCRKLNALTVVQYAQVGVGR